MRRTLVHSGGDLVVIVVVASHSWQLSKGRMGEMEISRAESVDRLSTNWRSQLRAAAITSLVKRL